jgi:hypothetical protein
LRGLEVCEAQSRHALVLVRKLRQAVDNPEQCKCHFLEFNGLEQNQALFKHSMTMSNTSAA